MADRGYVNLDDSIPIYVSGFGPKSQALAGRYGDGLVTSLPPEPRAIARAIETARRGAEADGRALPADFPVVSLTNVVILDPGEEVTSDRVIAEHGPFVVSSLHYVYDKIRPVRRRAAPAPAGDLGRVLGAGRADSRTGAPPPDPRRALHVPPSRRGEVHDRGDHPGTCIVGSADEVVATINDLDEAGLDELMLLPAPDHQVAWANRFAEQILPKLDR